MYIDPEDFTNFHRSDAELEAAWLFSLVVAGKTAHTQARLLNNFLRNLEAKTPFEGIRLAVTDSSLLVRLKESKLGQYNRLSKAFTESVSLNLRDCTVADLENIHGCGPKTARLFIMHTRPNQRLAAIDTHILKLFSENRQRFIAFSIERGLRINTVPSVTPSSKKIYQVCEDFFLHLADEVQQSPAEFDLATWTRFSRRTAR